MPFFVFKISQGLSLTHLETKDKYKDARTLVRQLRQGQAADRTLEYRMIFANSQAEAEKLLSTPRDERVIGED